MPTPAIREHLSKDPFFEKIIPLLELPELSAKRSLYEELLDAVVSQQVSVAAATTVFNRFLDLFENRQPYPQHLLALSPEQLRAVGLSRQKSGYLHNVATFFAEKNYENHDWSSQSDEEIINELTQIKGVGRWTVQMILMFTLHREDVFAIDDLIVQKSMIRAYQLTETGKPLRRRLEEIAKQWQPHRSAACRYLWRFKDVKNW